MTTEQQIITDMGQLANFAYVNYAKLELNKRYAGDFTLDGDTFFLKNRGQVFNLHFLSYTNSTKK